MDSHIIKKKGLSTIYTLFTYEPKLSYGNYFFSFFNINTFEPVVLAYYYTSFVSIKILLNICNSFLVCLEFFPDRNS